MSTEERASPPIDTNTWLAPLSSVTPQPEPHMCLTCGPKTVTNAVTEYTTDVEYTTIVYNLDVPSSSSCDSTTLTTAITALTTDVATSIVSYTRPRPPLSFPSGDREIPSASPSWSKPPLILTTEINHTVPPPTDVGPSPTDVPEEQCPVEVTMTVTSDVVVTASITVTVSASPEWHEPTVAPRNLDDVLEKRHLTGPLRRLSATKHLGSPASSKTPSPPQSTAAFKTKRGIIASQTAIDALASLMGNYPKMSWLGDWYSGPPSTISSNLVFVPQMYGKDSDDNGDFTRNAQAALKTNGREHYFLSFGEPGTPNPKLYMNAQDAAKLWMAKLEPYASQGITIGAPGTLQNTQDFQYLTDFLKACSSCSIGFIAIHWFDRASDTAFTGFKNTVNKALAVAATAGKGGTKVPVWVDNFQAGGTPEAQKMFLAQAVPWLDAQAGVQAYAYVPSDSSANPNSEGQGFVDPVTHQLTDLAKYYAQL